MNKFFNDIKELYDKKKMPNKILLSGKKGLGKSTLAYHIINYILSVDEDFKYDEVNFNININNRSFKLLQNHTHPNFYLIDLIDEKKNIDVAQVREMIAYTNKSSFNNTPRFILIDNIENLNKNSVNALLKIVEEPNYNIYFILIHNIEKTILPTLKSRCLQFKINFSFNETINISSKIIGENVHDLINYDLISYYNTPGDITGLINFSNEKKINLKEHSLTKLLRIMIDNSYYKKNKILKILMINLIELYFLKEYKTTTSKISLLNIYHNFINKINNSEIYNLDDESLFLEFKTRLLNE
ncbi:AAA family ATPase [Candidatus Pelagibacter sp.]|nr:AAA family ATPase [Candidatus Pelagibacter sp.]